MKFLLCALTALAVTVLAACGGGGGGGGSGGSTPVLPATVTIGTKTFTTATSRGDVTDGGAMFAVGSSFNMTGFGGNRYQGWTMTVSFVSTIVAQVPCVQITFYEHKTGQTSRVRRYDVSRSDDGEVRILRIQGSATHNFNAETTGSTVLMMGPEPTAFTLWDPALLPLSEGIVGTNVIGVPSDPANPAEAFYRERQDRQLLRLLLTGLTGMTSRLASPRQLMPVLSFIYWASSIQLFSIIMTGSN